MQSAVMLHPLHYCTKGRYTIRDRTNHIHEHVIASLLISNFAIKIDCNSFCDSENVRLIFATFMNMIIEKNIIKMFIFLFTYSKNISINIQNERDTPSWHETVIAIINCSNYYNIFMKILCMETMLISLKIL